MFVYIYSRCGCECVCVSSCIHFWKAVRNGFMCLIYVMNALNNKVTVLNNKVISCVVTNSMFRDPKEIRI